MNLMTNIYKYVKYTYVPPLYFIFVNSPVILIAADNTPCSAIKSELSSIVYLFLHFCDTYNFMLN